MSTRTCVTGTTDDVREIFGLRVSLGSADRFQTSDPVSS